MPVAPPRLALPPHVSGMRIGLFGGTFDPPHDAHLAACLLAMKRLGLDRVWWLVTPGNPLKDTRGLAPLPARIVKAPGGARVLFEKPVQAVVPGQFAVFYSGTRVLGGGLIRKAEQTELQPAVQEQSP